MRLCVAALRQCCTQSLSPVPALWQKSLFRTCAAAADGAPSSLPRRQSSSTAASAWPSHTEQQRHYSSDGASPDAVLSNTQSYLRNLHNGAEIFLVGTAHVSKQSAEEVRDMIRLVNPDSVMVELCAGRAARLRSGASTDQDSFKSMLASLLNPNGGTLSQKLVQVSIPTMYRGMQLLGLDPGQEFKVAMEEADRMGARVVYGDRDAQQTLNRLSETMNLQDLMRMMSGMGMPDPPPGLKEFFTKQGGSSLESQLEGMKTRATVRQMAQYMRQVNPRLAEALIDERDQFMVDSLARLTGRVVAVVGLAHLDGMERRWEALQYGRKALVGH